MIGKYAQKFCCDDVSLIPNYELALNDKSQTWVCHHILEIDLELTQRDLKDRGLYFNRPASELIFLTRSEHAKIHYANNSIGFRGRTASEETKQKIGAGNRGKKYSEETRSKMSEKKER